MEHISPSHLAVKNLCARYTPDDVENEAAANGTLWHDDMYHLIGDHPVNPGENPLKVYEPFIAGLDRSDDHKDMMRKAVEEVQEMLALGLKVVKDARFTYDMRISTIEPGIYLEAAVELWPDDRKHKVGRIDMLVVPDADSVFVIDWKSNIAEADFEWQLKSYLAALHRICSRKWSEMVARVVAPNLDHHDDVVLRPDEVAAWEAKTHGVEERAHNPFVPPCPGEVQCKYCRCKRLGQCPALAAVAVGGHPMAEIPDEYRENVREVMSMPRVLLSPTNLEERAARRNWCAVASMVIDFAKEDDKQYFQDPKHAGDQLPGYKVSTRTGNAYTDPTKFKELNRKLMELTGKGYEDMLPFWEPRKEALVEDLAEMFGTKKAAEEKYSEVVARFQLRGAPITTVRRDASRKLPKLSRDPETGNLVITRK